MAGDLDRRPPTRGELNRALVLNAATKPVNVVVPAGIVVVALVANLWWLIPVVALPAFLALVVVTYLDGDEAERVGARLRGERERAVGGALRVDPRSLAPPIGSQLQAAFDEERRIREAIAASELGLEEVGAEVAGLVRAMERTASRAQILWAYLATQDPQRIRLRATQLEHSGDPSARPVVQALREQVRALDALHEQLQRFFAQMEHTVASLSTMHAQLLRMTMASQSDGERELADEARELREQVNARGWARSTSRRGPRSRRPERHALLAAAELSPGPSPSATAR
jgi:hypothetical protein